MTLEWLIQTYGYPLLFLGTFLEGETVLLIGGFLAHRGYLELPWVMLAAFVGSLTGDQFFFLLGRRKGRPFIASRPHWARQANRVQSLLERYETPVLLGFRFLYGLRIVTPLILGASGFRPLRFLGFNAAGAVVWAVVVGGAGYLFGHGLELVLEDVKRYELWILLILGLVGGIAWAVRWSRRRAGAKVSAPRTADVPTAGDPPRVDRPTDDSRA